MSEQDSITEHLTGKTGEGPQLRGNQGEQEETTCRDRLRRPVPVMHLGLPSGQISHVRQREAK